MVAWGSTGRRRAVAVSAMAWLLVGGVAAVGGAASGALAPGVTTRVSVSSAGAQSDRESFSPAVSGNGRYVAFTSNATNLVPGDTNLTGDVFVRDRASGVTRRVSVATGGAEGNLNSFEPAISAHGRYVAFYSSASNLVPRDTNGAADVFVRDRALRVTRKLSVGLGGTQADDSSFDPAISADGRYVAFESLASNLVADDTNGAADIFVRDRSLGVTERVSLGSAGQESFGDSSVAAISADGRYVTFESFASDLVPGDTNERRDVFLRDRIAGVTRRVSVGASGVQANGSSAGSSVSAHGRYVAFGSFASNLVARDTNGASDVFVRDRTLGVTRRVSVGVSGAQAGGSSFEPAVSSGGRYVAFYSGGTNLVAGDTNQRFDVFVRDRSARLTLRVSVGAGGTQANDDSAFPALSRRAESVAFFSEASNLVAGDTNGVTDVFVHDPLG